MTAPPVAVSCGEPAGIGPELAARAWQALGATRPFFLIGDPGHLPPGTPTTEIDAPEEAAEASRHGLPVLRLPFPAPARPGRPDPANAAAVIEAIALGVRLVRGGRARALCTLPIQKSVLAEGAGFAFPGHTEYLAALGEVDCVAMMLVSPELRVVPATIHIPLSEVPRALTPEVLESAIRLTHDGLVRLFGIAHPRIAVTGLNPHAGEAGRMGREEIAWISPLLERLREEGLDLSGPRPADTMFHAAARADYDAAVAMYHDQALIPVKTLDFDRGVNLTLGLPFLRTSPDHGTALDIAGTGRANPASTLAALDLAWRLSGGAA
ncbi:4-hydroxythreonine-4-phosphate dehydrogenase PdxA [Rhodosalinus sp. K401]|uniref:4-hydroxythreonine-4-phosphate dehydrogenase PdxA n=1 Tax=Rhodosalinus sp. K401 TaxID=3239195 RepID=UPI003523F379